MDVQYNQYNNLYIFAEEWRKYKVLEERKNVTDFRKQMQFMGYIDIKCINELTGRPVIMYLFTPDSKFSQKSADLKKLLTQIADPSDVILVSQQPLKIYAKRVIPTFKHLRIKTYLHEFFSLIIPHGPLCYPHRIMEKKEVVNLLNNELKCRLLNLPKIYDSDPQCIWIGAEVGDVLEITANSPVNGEFIQYKVVIPKTRRSISFRSTTTSVEEEEEEDEEIVEHRDELYESDIE